MTNNIERRLKEHETGLARWTKKAQGPYKVVLLETCRTRKEALGREKFLKSGQGRELLKTSLTN